MAKKDFWLLIDNRVCNKITNKYRYPLPFTPSVLEQLHRGQIFTTVDLRRTYNLIRILEGDECTMAYITPTGHYEYLVMLWSHQRPLHIPGLHEYILYICIFYMKIFWDYLHRFVLVIHR